MIYNFDELSFQILTVDRFIHNSGFFDVKARPYAALSFRVSGCGSFEIAGKRITTNEGDVLFLPAYTPYKVEYSVNESIVVHLDSCNYFETENICIANKTSIASRFDILQKEWNKSHSANRAKSAVYDILDRISSDKKTSIDDVAFSNCLRYMEENFSSPSLSISSVCEYGFVSVSSLQRSFLKHIGISPGQYLCKLRLSKALELLSDNTQTIKQIAFSCGFADEKYFSRAFKRFYGYPPSNLRFV